MPAPQNQARMAQIFRQLAAVPPDVRETIAAEAIASQKAILPWPYYSTARFSLPVVAATTYALAAGTQVKLFNYQIGQEMTGAGYATGTIAKPSDTNLLKASETRDNADVFFWGVCAELCTASISSSSVNSSFNVEADLAKHLWRHLDLTVSLSGTDQYELGPLSIYPSAGGLYGAGQSRLFALSATNPNAASLSTIANGNPMAGNFYRIPNALRWNANGGGKKDTSLVMTLTNNRDLAFVSEAAAGGFSPPAALNVDIRIHLVSVSVSERSNNA